MNPLSIILLGYGIGALQYQTDTFGQIVCGILVLQGIILLFWKEEKK